MKPSKTKINMLDVREQKRKNSYLQLPHKKLVEILVKTRFAMTRRNQMIRTLQKQIRELQKGA